MRGALPARVLILALALSLSLTAFAPQNTSGAAQPLAQGGFCGYDPGVENLLGEVTFESWSGWVRGLSGDVDVQVGGETRRITSRYSARLFDGTSPAYDYVLEQISAWYPAEQIEEDPYTVFPEQAWKNLILTVPGAQFPGEVVTLTAHLDSTSTTQFAPGADDNATGSAALLEAARVLRGSPLPRTVRIIWFTGEEAGMLGSRAYASDHPLANVVGVINLDMIGYDGDGDRCFELHVGALPQSQPVGQCFVNALEAYQIDLQAEILTYGATSRSDHSSFWNRGVGALAVAENFFDGFGENSCGPRDVNPNYHSPQDTYANMHPQYGYDVARAGLAAAFSLASEGPLYRVYFPFLPLLKNE